MYHIILWFILNLANPPHVPFQGTYSYFYGKGAEEPFRLIKIHYVNQSTILFYLEVGRGAPSYNMGSLYGRLLFNEKNGRYKYVPKDLSADCEFEIIKQKDKLIIKTVAGNCPFGGGVSADGVYQLKSIRNPQYFTNGAGMKVYFDRTSPEGIWR
jgi:hypothetical protein